MSRIPEDTRQRLASSAVGTPGADRSISQAFAGAARGFQAFEQREARDQAIQQRELESQQNSLDKISATRRDIDFDIALGKIQSGAKNADDFNTQATDLFDRMSGQIESDRERELFSTKAASRITKRNDMFFDQERARNISKAEDGINQVLDKTASQISDVFDPVISPQFLDLGEQLDEFSVIVEATAESLEDFRDFIPPKEFNRIREEAAESFIEAAINSMYESNPENVEAFLQSEVLTSEGSSLFAGIKPQEVRDTANQYIKQRQATAELNKQRAVSTMETEFVNQFFTDNPPTENDIAQAERNGTITREFANKYRDFKRSDRAVFATDNPKDYADLIQQFSEFSVHTKGSKRGQVKSDTESLGELAIFRQSLLESMAAGKISKETGERFMNRVTPAFNESFKSFFEAANTVKNANGEIGWFADNVLSGADVSTGKMRMQNDLMKFIDIRERELQRRLTASELDGIADNIKKNFTINTNPNRTFYKEGEIIRNDLWGYVKVVGYDKDGEPIVDTDLNAPLSSNENSGKK